MSDTVKVCAPDTWVREVDGVSGRRYRSRDGAYEMSPADAKALVSIGGFLPSLGAAFARATGFRCTGCGFGSFFRRCSRCGGDCHKEGEDASRSVRAEEEARV